MHLKSNKVCIITRSTLASLLFKGLATKHTTVKWTIQKKNWSPFSKTNKTFFYDVSVLDRPSKIKVGKRSLTCYKVDTRMDDIQRSGSSKSKMASSYRSRCMCYVLETNLTRKFAADLSLQIFLIHWISWYGYDETF